jgi:plasmid stabilization system protein ParE
MAQEVIVTESAERDLDEILGYIAQNLANPKAAADFADALERKYTELEHHPFLFELSRNERLAKKKYRRFVVGNYIALYLVDENNCKVTIARIFYGAREYEKYL